jgi:cobalt-zinc-cadmium efflux system membrane fusion protein
MNNGLIATLLIALTVPLLISCGRMDGSDDSVSGEVADSHATAEAQDAGMLRMAPAEREAQGILTTRAQQRAVTSTISAPGEARTNAYASAIVTPRISAQIVARHMRLGDAVEPGQALVTLSSVPMAEAQGALIEADREWQRVRALGRDVVSEARYVSAQVARQRSYATVTAYGMAEPEIQRLLEAGDATHATGEFALLSPRSGTVIRDDFITGELIEPGRVLFEISDESILWIQAELSSVDVGRIVPGSKARISRDGERWIEGTIVQLQHLINETTRTQGVRIEVDNSDESLHPGDYVDVVLETSTTAGRIAVPNEAVVLMQGDPTVFRVEGDELHARPVEPGDSAAGWTVIEAGLALGDEVVTQGAFLVKSLLLRSEMGEGHAD